MELAARDADAEAAQVDGRLRSEQSRLTWLRERLAELAQSLDRVPTTTELSTFLRRYRVAPTELDGLLDMGGLDAQPQRVGLASAPSSLELGTVCPPAAHLIASTPRSACQTELPLPAGPSTSTPGGPESEGPRLPRDEVVGRAVDDLVDDWHRTGNALRYEDVTRLVSKRALSAEQSAAVLAALDECGIEVEGLASRAVSDVEDSGETEVVRTTQVSSDGIRSYLAEISRYPLIWAEDEVRLGRQIQAGLAADAILQDAKWLAGVPAAQQVGLRNASAAGRRAHRDMVCANLRLVVSIAKHRSYQGSGVELNDRIQDGNAGLMRAANKFDPTRGFKFSTYATWWVRQFISRGIGDRGRLIRLPVHIHEKVQKLRRTQRLLADRFEREPTLTELSEYLEWDAGVVQAMLDCSQPVASLDVGVGTEGDLTLGDLLSDQADVDGRTDPVNCVIESACSRDLDAAMHAVLSTRDREVIRRRYGFHGTEEETLDEIGGHFGVTRERIRQIQGKAVVKLRKPSVLNQLRAYLFDESPDQQAPANAQTPVESTEQEEIPATPVRRRAKTRSTSTAAKLLHAPTEADVRQQQFLYETIGEAVDAS